MNTFVILAGVDLIQLKQHNLQLSLFPEIQNIHFAVKTRWYLLEWHLLGLLVPLCQLVCCSSALPCICTCGITALALRCCKPAQAAACAQCLWSSHWNAFMRFTAVVSGELRDGRSIKFNLHSICWAVTAQITTCSSSGVTFATWRFVRAHICRITGKSPALG